MIIIIIRYLFLVRITLAGMCQNFVLNNGLIMIHITAQTQAADLQMHDPIANCFFLDDPDPYSFRCL